MMGAQRPLIFPLTSPSVPPARPPAIIETRFDSGREFTAEDTAAACQHGSPR